MGRSIELTDTEIHIPQEGSGDSPIKVGVIVDGQTNNPSFTMDGFNDYWFTYTTERYEDITDTEKSYVNIVIRASKNLDTYKRYGTISVSHNNASVYGAIELEQDAADYSLEATYDTTTTDKPWVFSTVPNELYEEHTLKLKASYGQEKWYVKEIQQYVVFDDGDEFDDIEEEYIGSEEQDAKMNQVKIPYDGVFEYRIEDNNLIVRSYGQIDLNNHTRYFFVLCHSDVDNANSANLDSSDITYQVKKLFVFDGNDIDGYKQ